MVMPRYSHPHENKTHTCTQRAYGIKDDTKCGRKALSICQPVSILHLNSNIRLCNKQAVEYIGWKLLDLPWPNSSACWQGRACSHPRPLNTLTDESERCYFLFSCISSWHSKCMVFHTKEKYLRIQHMVTDFPSYLILYYTLDFPGRDVYLIPFFCRAWIFTLPLLPCGSIVVCFWLLPILPQRDGDKEPISEDSAWSRKPFLSINYFSKNISISLIDLLLLACLKHLFASLTISPNLRSSWLSTWCLISFLHFILAIFVVYGQTLLLSVANSWSHKLNAYIWQNWYICLYFCYSNFGQRSELEVLPYLHLQTLPWRAQVLNRQRVAPYAQYLTCLYWSDFLSKHEKKSGKYWSSWSSSEPNHTLVDWLSGGQ